MMTPMPKSPLKPGLALAILVAGNVFATIFMHNLGAGIGDIADPRATQIAHGFYSFFEFTMQNLLPFLVAVLLFVVYRVWRGKETQWGIDILGGLLTLRCFIVFVLLNLLLLSQLRAGGLLLMQLILFLPVITLNFGWLYWRLDAGARMKGRRHIRFAEDDESPSPFDYFYVATRTLLQFEPSGATAASRPMKTLFVIHGMMMLDLVALTLSRGISLASAG